jgi:hypothetical protein
MKNQTQKSGDFLTSVIETLKNNSISIFKISFWKKLGSKKKG